MPILTPEQLASVRTLLMDGVDATGGIIIFPEGTRYTPAKRERILNKLEELGQTDVLEWARGYRHVLPPRTAGPLALFDRAVQADADIVFCAHTGLERSSSFKDTFNGSLVGATVLGSFRIDPVPEGEDGAGELGDLLPDPHAADPAEEAGEAVRRSSVLAALRALPELERRILELRFGFDGEQQSLDAIAREIGMSRERVRHLEQQALAQLAGELEGVIRATGDELASAA